MAWGRGAKGEAKVDGPSSSSSSSSSSGGGTTKDDSGSGGEAHWLLHNEFVNFALMNTNEIKYMCMLGYTFLHGCKIFKSLDKPEYSSAYKFISMIFACNGGGILVPIFLNTIPVSLSIDAYPVAIVISFGLHTYFPVLREVVELSAIFKGLLIVFYEVTRAYVVTLFVGIAATTIPASQFTYPVFGPIICGTLGGCGGAFFPFTKGLDPVKKGLPPPMWSAFVGAMLYHFLLIYGETWAEYLANAPAPEGPFLAELLREKATEVGKVMVVIWFIGYAFYTNDIFGLRKKAADAVPSTSNKYYIENSTLKTVKKE